VLRRHGRSPTAHFEPPPAPPLRPPPVEEQVLAERDWPAVHAPTFINSDFRPIGYFHSLLLWGDLTRSEQAEQLAGLMRVQPTWIAWPVAGVLALVLLLRLFGKSKTLPPERRLAVGLAVFSTGLATMAMQIALLFAFQSQYGFVYEMIGLIVALFMAGLATGTALAQRWIPDLSSLVILARVQGIIALFALAIALLLPVSSLLPGGVSVFVFFATLTFLSGVLNGVDFPLATEAFRAINRRAEKSAGLVYGIELAGACIGAALASALVAPIMGIVACCVLAAIANGSAWAALMMTRRPDVA
jgi:spermidine synthase